jgi:type IV pilus assembly protein PilB
LHIPYVDLENYTLDPECIKYIAYNDAIQYKVIPLFKIENELTIAMSDPLDLLVIDKIADKLDFDIAPVLSAEKSILAKIAEYYQIQDTVGEIFSEPNSVQFNWQDELHDYQMGDEHIPKIIKAILTQAVYQNIHELYMEQTENGLSINFKKSSDEVIHTGNIPHGLVAQFVSKLKRLADLDPLVSEIPQLGKLIFKADTQNLVASVASFPTIQGERILLKIYRPPVQLNKIISDTKKLEIINRSFSQPGFILVCGSPLSGKTHIIYSILSELAKNNKNVMTLESIAKYNLENVNQSELNENVGFNLDKAMRFIEFQDPDVIYFEGVTTKEGLDFFTSLVFKNKSMITEFLANNIEDLRHKLTFDEFLTFKSLINCLIFIHNKDSIEIFDKVDLQKYLT